MKKYKVFVIMLVTIMCLGSVSIPNAFSQVVNTNVKVLSYSWYVNSSGDFIVVGEVQNTGNSILSSVTLNATAYDSGGSALAGSSAMAYVSYFLPQQKAPFYIDFGPSNVAGTDWTSTVSSVDFTAFNAYSTSDQQYESLALGNVAFNGTLGGPYIVMGLVFNIGNQTANGIRVVGTYYNSLGTVIAVGFDMLNDSLPPYNATTYTVSEFDATPSLVAQISNYSLLIQTSTLQNNNTLLPSASPTKPLPDTYVYAIVAGTAVVAVILIIVALLMFRKRKVASVPPPPPPLEEHKASDLQLSRICLIMEHISLAT